MFARQVDPLAEYTSAISAAEMRHRASQEAFDNGHSHDLYARQSPIQHSFNNASHGIGISKNASHSNNPCKRKHAFHFEPEFFAALDSSIGDDSSSSINYNKSNDNNNNSNSNNNINSNSNCSGRGRTRSSWSTSTKPPLKKMKKSTISNINNDTQRQIHPLKVFVSQATPTNIQSISEQSLPNNPVLAKMSFKQQQQQQQQQQQRFSQPPKATSWIHMSHKNILHNENNTPPFRQNLAGPYIIDLSSGEELIALHLGNNDNKRRRDEDNDNESMSPIESTSSPTEVFEYQEDGNLLPIRDYFPMQPSPAKKFRLAKCSHQPSLRFLSDSESDVEREGGIRIKKQKDERLTSGNRPYHRSKLQRRSGADITWKKKSGFSQGNNSSTISSRRYGCDEAGDSSANDVVFEFQTRDHHKEATYQIESIQDDTIEDKPSAKIEKNEIALLPTPKLYSLSNGLRDFDWSRWEDMNTANIVFYEQSMGNELVLYNGRGSTRLDGGKGDDYGYSWKATGEDNYQSSVVIHELDDEDGYEDDDGNFADDEACELSDDGPLIELEEKIMDMDLY